jgi:3-oxoacyl-[acyl-carrier-protein] synthase II
MAFEAAGPCLTVSATCASGAYAIILGAQQILLGTAEVMLVGGTDAPLQDAVIRQLLSTGILGSHADPRRACRPFDVRPRRP